MLQLVGIRLKRPTVLFFARQLSRRAAIPSNPVSSTRFIILTDKDFTTLESHHGDSFFF